MKRAWLFILALATATPAAGQVAPASRAEGTGAMYPLGVLVGEWVGTSTTRTGPDTETSTYMREKAGFKAGGNVLVLEGMGTHSENGHTRVVHDAYAAVTWNAEAEKYEMRAYRAGQGWVDTELSVADDGNTMQWGLESPAGSVRFTLDFSEADRWVEIGEIQRGGQWYPFLRMELDRVR
ncbi:MAG: hypothetical protein OEM96_11305 [Gemmatimonadota bacterium]|nr:hypothetical protein [Gemmatimonadota bacterium]